MYDLYNLVQCWLWQRWNHGSIIVTINGDKWRCMVPGQGKNLERWRSVWFLAREKTWRGREGQTSDNTTVSHCYGALPLFKHPIVLYSCCAALLGLWVRTFQNSSGQIIVICVGNQSLSLCLLTRIHHNHLLVCSWWRWKLLSGKMLLSMNMNMHNAYTMKWCKVAAEWIKVHNDQERW